MKTIKLIIISLFISTLCHSQSTSFSKIYKCICLKYVNNKWIEYKTNYPENIFVIIKGNEVIITNQAECKIVTYGSPEISKYVDGELSTWDAYDDKGRSCLFMLRNFTNYKNYIFTIAYMNDLIGFQYFSND